MTTTTVDTMTHSQARGPMFRTGLLLALASGVALISAGGAILMVFGAFRWSVPVAAAIGVALALLSTVLLAAWNAIKGWALRLDAKRAWGSEQFPAARTAAADARERAWASLGFSTAVLIVIGGLMFVAANDASVARTFFDWDLLKSSALETLRAFKVNIIIALAAEALALTFALALALGRLLPGKSARPLRLLSIFYIDMVRGIPSIVIIYLICFGVPLAGITVISDASPMVYAIVALAVTYSAYNAELIRSGIESIHASQMSAALSLGLTYGTATRRVILPQMLRNMAPALLSSFVSLQKDTALVSVVGVVDTFSQAKIYANNAFNLSPVLVVCFIFILITIPQTRIVDSMIARSDRRMRA